MLGATLVKQLLSMAIAGRYSFQALMIVLLIMTVIYILGCTKVPTLVPKTQRTGAELTSKFLKNRLHKEGIATFNHQLVTMFACAYFQQTYHVLQKATLNAA